MEDKNYICINCGDPVDELYKQYSPNVLKLTKCKKCDLVADKYIEYDTAIIIIDLVLLNREAYRHVLFNSDYSNYWKLWIILELMEAYSEWSIRSPSYYKNDFEHKKPLMLEHFASDDFDYYKIMLKVVIRSLSFFLVIYLMTLAYNTVKKRDQSKRQTLREIWRCVTLSSFGIFLSLPSLIWDKYSLQEYHYAFVCLYTTLSQLVACTVTCKCSKLWSIFVILTSYFCKIVCSDYINALF